MKFLRSTLIGGAFGLAVGLGFTGIHYFNDWLEKWAWFAAQPIWLQVALYGAGVGTFVGLLFAIQCKVFGRD